MISYLQFDELDDTQRALLLAAEGAMVNAYCPYSTYSVGAALLGDNGHIYTGVNVESAAYEVVHAECAAVASAINSGCRVFTTIAIMVPASDANGDICGPCGSCRQMLYEFAAASGKELQVICANTKRAKIVIANIIDLLPLPFGPADLGTSSSTRTPLKNVVYFGSRQKV